MGKDDKNRRKGASASSSRAAELLQSAGHGIQFMNLGEDPSVLQLPIGGESSTDEFGDVDPEFRINLNKLNKKVANTREKGLKNLAELVEKVAFPTSSVKNGIRHFVPLYCSLAFDSVSNVRAEANNTLSVMIQKLRKDISEHIVKMLPTVLLSTFDPLPTVRKSATDLLEKCFDEGQRTKIYANVSPQTVKLCLEVVQKKHALVRKQKFEDMETPAQRSDRILMQAFSAIGDLSVNCLHDTIEQIFTTIDSIYDSTIKANIQVANALLTCIFKLLKNGHADVFMLKDCSVKFLKLLTSEHESLCRSAFASYLYMAEAVQSGNVETSFTKEEFINNLVLRMVTNKGKHYSALQETLLPLIIMEIKYAADEKPYAWIIEVLSAFFKGDATGELFLAWALTFIDVVDWLYKVFLLPNWDSEFANYANFTTLRFVHAYIDRHAEISTEARPILEKQVVEFTVARLSSTDERLTKFTHDLAAKLVNSLPKSSDLLDEVLSRIDLTSEEPSSIAATLTAQILVNSHTPESLFKRVLATQKYKSNEQINKSQLLTKLCGIMKSSGPKDEYLECYKFLQEQSICADHPLNQLVDMTSPANISQIMRVYGQAATSLLGDYVKQLLRSYVSSFSSNPSAERNLWNEQFVMWMEAQTADDAQSIILDHGDGLNLGPLTKLVLVLNKSALPFNSEQRIEIANLVVKKLFTFADCIPESDCQEFNRFIAGLQFDVKPHADRVCSDIEASLLSELEKWWSIGKHLQHLPYITDAFQLSTDIFNVLAEDLDSMFSEHILLVETMLLSAALTEGCTFQSSDADRRHTLAEMMRIATFYVATGTENLQMRLYVCLFYALSKLYSDGILQDELCHHLPQFTGYLQETIKDWNMQDLCERFVQYLIDSEKQIPFTILYMLRQLKEEFNVVSLADLFASSSLDDKQKLRAVAALTTKVPSELLPENDEYVHFINSLERTSERLKKDPAQEDVALIILADLRNKTEDWDFLFSVSGEDLKKDALSCALMRLCTQLSHLVPNIESSLRDFVLCGLITAAESFSARPKNAGPIRLLASLALRFFVDYDVKLTDVFCILNSAATTSDDVIERRSKIEATRHEWREFFGNSMGSYLIAWYFWSTFADDNSGIDFPEFFRIQLCKCIQNADPNLGLFNYLHAPTPVIFEQNPEKANIGTKGLFDELVGLLFSKRTEMQFVSIHILQRELLNFLNNKSANEVDENMAKILAICDENPDDPAEHSAMKNIEHKVYDFFLALFNRLQCDFTDWSDINSLDPWLSVIDLLLRIVRLLDAQAAASFCSQLEGDAIHPMLLRLCSYLNFQQDPDVIKKYATTQPSACFTLESTSERMSLESYACWLYRRSLEIIPAVVRQWFAKIKDTRLKQFTQTHISPLIIQQELSNIGAHADADFTMRARTNTREIFVRYNHEEITTELSLILPEDYPLSQAIIEYEKRKVLDPALMNTLHKNLFAFVSNCNGSLIDGIFQWRRGIEKQIEGVEPCAICMMIVSTTNYRLPDMKCRQCKKKFHSDCMLKWIRTSAKPTCPLCRAEFT